MAQNRGAGGGYGQLEVLGRLADATIAADADSAIRAYRALRTRYDDRDAYDFSEASLNIAAFRAGRASKVDDTIGLRTSRRARLC